MPARRREPMGEGVVGQRAIGLDAVGDDLGHRVRGDQVDPLERGHDRAFGGPERGGRVASRT